MTKDEIQREIDKVQAEIDAELASLLEGLREIDAIKRARIAKANGIVEAARKRRSALLHEWLKEA